ncbi:hypothetical protein FACS1894219_00080 [Clostridia bacterium]|nr:hypothetical protein FACS1894219_00080 [Clostridia bacterium]
MSRPKKLTDADALRLVDSFYEQCGDPGRLRFSELEKHAENLNIDIKAYDLRRNPIILNRIAEIKALALSAESLETLAYKGLDVDAFILSNRRPDKLKRSLSEMDERWRNLYIYAVNASEHNRKLTDRLSDSDHLSESLKSVNTGLSGQLEVNINLVAALKSENRHLRGMLKEYLYPSLADEVLRNLGEYTNFESSPLPAATVKSMTDIGTPSSFSESAYADRALRSREDILLERLREQAREDSDNET